MDAREAPARQVGGDDAITTRIGAAMLPLAVVVLVVSEALHPGREDLRLGAGSLVSPPSTTG